MLKSPLFDTTGRLPMNQIVKDSSKLHFFASRWIQAPLYLGLIVAQMVYCYLFMVELSHLSTTRFPRSTISETDVMLVVLGLIDVVMIANLLIMVIVGGYGRFVSRSTSKAIRTSWSGCPTSMPAS